MKNDFNPLTEDCDLRNEISELKAEIFLWKCAFGTMFLLALGFFVSRL